MGIERWGAWAAAASIPLAFAAGEPREDGEPAAAHESAPRSAWVVLSVARDIDYATVQLGIRRLDGDHKHHTLGVNGFNALDTTMHDFGAGKKGYVHVHRVDPGTYEIYTYRLYFTPTRETFTPKREFSVRFEAKAKEAVYLGEFLATGTRPKPAASVAGVQDPYFVHTEGHQMRDMEIAVQETPELSGVPVHPAQLAVVKPGPFLKARLPD